MPPARTIFVDTDRMLCTIYSQAQQQADKMRERSVGMMGGERWLAESLPDAKWVPRELTALAGRLLTPSERKRHQEALRRLQADGLIDLCTVWVRLTDAGRAHVERIRRGPTDG